MWNITPNLDTPATNNGAHYTSAGTKTKVLQRFIIELDTGCTCLSFPGANYLVLFPNPRRKGFVLFFLPPLILVRLPFSLPLIMLSASRGSLVRPPPPVSTISTARVSISFMAIMNSTGLALTRLARDPLFPVPLTRCSAPLFLRCDHAIGSLGHSCCDRSAQATLKVGECGQRMTALVMMACVPSYHVIGRLFLVVSLGYYSPNPALNHRNHTHRNLALKLRIPPFCSPRHWISKVENKSTP